ncbi:MAG TPA: MarP family serine protease [Gaiellaceae bacterium]|nr:MarP family serine protease [Gaiellaceae bacterium]
MTRADWIALAVVAVAALAGLRTGLVAGALSLAGIAGGAVLGARLAPQFLNGGSSSPYTPLAALAGAVVLGGLLQIVGGIVGSLVRGTLRPLPPLRWLDSVGGFVLGAAAGLGLVWVLGAVALQLPGQTVLRRNALDSTIVRRLNQIVPPRTVLNALARIDPFPALAGPPPPAEDPDPKVLRLPGVKRAFPSVVRVTGTACGIGVEGSGWVGGRGLVVTAAHVVAGVANPTVQPRGRGPALDAVTVAFDRGNDVAVLRVAGLDARPLPLTAPRNGDSVAILGFPENGPFDAEAGRIGSTVRVLPGRTTVGGGAVPKTVTAVRGLVRHGNSGGPAVDGSGAVATTIFAARVGSRSGYGVPPKLVRAALARAGRTAVSTGPCFS